MRQYAKRILRNNFTGNGHEQSRDVVDAEVRPFTIMHIILGFEHTGMIVSVRCTNKSLRAQGLTICKNLAQSF